MSQNKSLASIAVLIEHRERQIKDISYEMLTLAHKIAHTQGYEITGIVLSDNCQPIVETIKSYCHNIICVEDKLLENFNTQIYLPVLAKIIQETRPLLTIIGHTGFGTDLAPYLAGSLSLPLLTDIFDLEISSEKILVRRQMYGGKVTAEFISKKTPAMVTVRTGSFEKIFSLPKIPQLSANLQKLPLAIDPSIPERFKFLGYGEVPTTGIDITKADIIVAVGRGIKEQKNLTMIENFANDIGATLACTRPIIDAGWLPKDRQVGSSGKTVKPKLYIALGISGAFQHISGMKNSETIIAINKDPEAPIFSVAHYGVVGDLLKIVPILATKIKELKS
ncbi:MAG: electron transfer flavoprotein subunit alpha/FixB family protein [candidate division WOR-3 bacterium]|nr:electron transfer flavoprotein subunit alpha/FixB family protein [candidate division WOR-3 bacterium]